MKNCLIFSGGTFCVPEKHYIQSADFIIACDKGLEYANKLNVKPNLALGDFDSFKGVIPSSIETIKLPCSKDDTDTMFAVRYAVEKKFTNIVISSAFGGRLDHSFANIQVAAFAAENGVNTTLLGINEIAYVIKNSSVSLKKKEGYSISVFSLSEKSFGVCEKGTKYKLNDSNLENTFPIGISNEWEDDYAEISVKDGIVLIVESKIE